MKPSQYAKIGCGCLLLITALCLALTVWWGNRLTERQERLLVRYSPETAEALCKHFGWDGEAFCSQPDLQNARELNELLQFYFPDGFSNYDDLKPYFATLPSFSYYCNQDPKYEGFGIGHCPPPEACGVANTSYYGCAIQMPGTAESIHVQFGIRTGRILSIGVYEYPESM